MHVNGYNYSPLVKQGKFFLVIENKEASPTEEDKAIFSYLHCKQVTKEPILVPSGKLLEILTKLSRLKKIKNSNYSLIVEPFTELHLIIAISTTERGTFFAKGVLQSSGKENDFSDVLAIFPTYPPTIQRGPLVQKLAQNISFEWLERIYPQGMEIDEETLDLWIQESREDEGPLLRLPVREKKESFIYPVLKLADRFGAFADLWFDYGAGREVPMHDPTVQGSIRSLDEEIGWEKDLLETGFCRKKVERTHYYCSMDVVSKSLRFLLEIGWRIIDYQGRVVIRQDKVEIVVEEEASSLVLKGQLSFGEYEADMGAVVGAFNRRERFIELSPYTVGLVEEESLPREIEEFSWSNGKLRASKSKCGAVEHLLSHSDLQELFLLIQEKREGGAFHLGNGFRGELYPYQKQAITWLSLLYEKQLAGLLADEMGLGKTVQTLGFISTLPRDKRVLIVAPTSLLFNWQREWERFLPTRELFIHSGNKRSQEVDLLLKQETILTSYAILRQDKVLFSSLEFAVIILDEAQIIKNHESQIAEVIFSLQSTFRLAITGTPLENRMEDIWSIFHFLLPGLLGGIKQFRSEMMGAELDRRYLERWIKYIKPFVLRRKKDIVAEQLPDKMEQIVFVEMEEKQRALYEAKLAESRKMIADNPSPKKMEVLEKILRLRQVCCHPSLVDASIDPVSKESGKIERVLEDLEEMVADKAKVLIYSQFTSLLSLLRSEIELRGWRFVYLDGQSTNREAIVAEFQEKKEVQLFLISLKTGGVGLNLTEADYVLLLDPWWNNAVEEQAVDRAHRIGRKGPVIAKRYITALSIEEKIISLKEHKKKLGRDLLGGVEEEGMFTTEEFLQLLD